jgi:hypothetical protein
MRRASNVDVVGRRHESLREALRSRMKVATQASCKQCRPVKIYVVFFFRQGAASRDIWGTAAGVTMAALYAAFVVGVYPWLHHAAVISAH